jgi:2-polyprenyl-6-hydroxyphenyl methylase/3-demethylubiquinone-9 3-methyltransferase
MERVFENSAYSAVGGRFEFGKNWTRFLSHIDDGRIEDARGSIAEKLRTRSLEGSTFIDVGCGSGLFSLAARQLGARVLSFDYDPNSVSCTQQLRHRFLPNDPAWSVNQGSVLDTAYLGSLGQFDIVYSWGVLHHTGGMWDALGNVATLVKPGGSLFIAIYNDAGESTRRWKVIKRLYNASSLLRGPLLALVAAYYLASRCGKYALHPSLFFNRPKRERGMARATDFVDWVGGYPFEFAAAEEIFEFYRQRGFTLSFLKTRIGNACNEFVFTRSN